MKWLIKALLGACVVAVSACGEACDLVQKPGIALTIVDAVTGNLVEGEVTVIVTDGSYTETVSRQGGIVGVAYERPGTYRIEVQGPGYIPWVATNITVTEGDCHVEPVELTAELEKAEEG